MRKCILLLLVLLPLLSEAFVWEIAQDGSGDFSEIQTAIDIVESGDTLLVHPGTYYENILIFYKDIHLMSLYAVTQDTSYIHTTILDGSHTSNVVYYYYPPESVSLTGFTIINGYSRTGIENCFHHGAGVIFFGDELEISHCIIEHNYSEYRAGGVYIADGSLYLKGTIIRYNVGVDSGGGLAFGNDGILFDSEDLNSIYCNYARLGSDIYISVDSDYSYNFPMQRGTSLPPNRQYFYDGYNDDDMFNVSYDEVYITETCQEVYVSPDGDNSNDGISSESPLKNIWYATLKCEGDVENPGIIHIAAGTYSRSSNDELPVTGLKSNMYVIGSGSDCTILDRENESGVFGVLKKENNQIEGFTICNDSGEFTIHNLDFCGYNMSGSAEVEDIVCENNSCNAISVINYDIFELNNVGIYDNSSLCNTIQMSSIYRAELKNLKIKGGYPLIEEGTGDILGGFGIIVVNGNNIQEPLDYYFENVCITDLDSHVYQACLPFGYAINGDDDFLNLFLINSTISGNITNNNSLCALGANNGANLYIYNSIVYNNEYHSLMIGGNATAGETYIGVTHSLVEGGFDDMVDLGGDWTAEWLEGNLDIDENPEYCGVGKSEFSLQNDSPCIDSGTLTGLPEGYELCETDLAGNPRVYGDGIDMGCYEWQGTECDFDWEQEQSSVSFSVISNEEIYDIGWDFECDEEIDSYELNPTHIYTENGTYSVGVYINEGRGGRKYETCLTITTVGIIEEEIANAPLSCRNYPNPFNPRTTIEFDLPAKGEVTLAVYDIKGRKVKEMLNAVLETGKHSFIWNGRNDDDLEAASGIYFYEIKWAGQKIRNKINLLK